MGRSNQRQSRGLSAGSRENGSRGQAWDDVTKTLAKKLILAIAPYTYMATC